MRHTKTRATHLVALASFASSVEFLDFVMNVSDEPDIAPERPELLPDWNRTIKVRARHDISWTIVMAKVMEFIPFIKKG